MRKNRQEYDRALEAWDTAGDLLSIHDFLRWQRKRDQAKKLEYDDIPKEYILDYDHYQSQEISVAEIAERNCVSRKMVYKYSS